VLLFDVEPGPGPGPGFRLLFGPGVILRFRRSGLLYLVVIILLGTTEGLAGYLEELFEVVVLLGVCVSVLVGKLVPCDGTIGPIY
jgi:hypothetical protein